MKKIIVYLIVLFAFQSCGNKTVQDQEKIQSFEIEINSSCANELKDYKHYSVVHKNDTINYHTFSKSSIDSIENILLFIQGSGGFPLFRVKRENENLWISSSVPFNTKDFPENYLFVVVSKKGIPFCSPLSEDYSAPTEYYENETLDYRVKQADLVIQDLISRRKEKEYQKIIALGHSEGSDVIAKLGTINKNISHFGFWSGSGNSQWYDFPLFIRQQVNRGEISEEEGIKQMDSLFDQYRDIVKNKDNIEKSWLENSYKRWYYFSEPPIENLLKINKPIFVAMGTADKSVPIESIYLIPVEFIRKGKNNLTFNTYPNLSHNLDIVLDNGKRENHWNRIFLEFLKWTEKQ